MSLENEIKSAIEHEINQLEISARLDGDNDLEIALIYKGTEIHTTFVELDKVFLKTEP